jgi:hypothetical protein
MSAADVGDQEETILEYTIRERLNKEQLSELLSSLGGQKSGSRDELAQRLLSIKGLKPRDVLNKLSTDDLKVLARRFSIAEPSKPTGLTGFASSFLSDERSTLLKRIEEAASKERGPAPRSESSRPPVESRVAPPSPAPRSPPPAVERAAEPARTAPMTPAAGAPAGLPAFQETRDFVGSYKFSYQWTSEDLYEAELLGSLRGRFGSNNALRQQGESGRVFDIVVRNSAIIEVKMPKSKADLDRMSGQVRRYIALHPGGVIVVIAGFNIKNQQELHNSQEELERAGAVVFVK